VARAFDATDAAADAGDPFHVVHDHTGFAALAMAHRLRTPLLHTLHGPFDPHISAFYAAHGGKGRLVAISAAQRADGPEHLRGAPCPRRLGKKACTSRSRAAASPAPAASTRRGSS
jgi:hypothetical protein